MRDRIKHPEGFMHSYFQNRSCRIDGTVNGPYILAVLKELGASVDMSHGSPDFICEKPELIIEATICNEAAGDTQEWEKSLGSIGKGDLEDIYVYQMGRLSNAIASKVQKLRKIYSKLPHVTGKPFIIALANYGSPDFFLTGDVAMQRLLYDVWEEGDFKKPNGIDLPTGLFMDPDLQDVSAIVYSSVASHGKARALSRSTFGHYVFNAFRIRNNIEPIQISGPMENYYETLCDGLRLFHNPYAKYPVPESLFSRPDIREFKIDGEGEILTTCNPEGDLVARMVIAQR